jgi:ribonuclease HI
MSKRGDPIIVVHADESCLGNGREGSNPGGAASLIEVRTGERIDRQDVYISSARTTNNRMALAGAIATLALLQDNRGRCQVAYVSDSQYLIKGMTEWVPNWRARGWRRKGGKVENLELWQTLLRVAASHQVEWIWVRGHTGHPKNEYVNDLAIRAASGLLTSDGAVGSGFDQWLADQRLRSLAASYDPDEAFTLLEAKLRERV